YQNLGDMALTYSQKRFIESALPDHEVVLFPSRDSYQRMKALKDVCGPGDVITTIAGGNMDDVYPSLENARRFVVRSFPKNPVISFPQTFAFSETANGRKSLRRSARTYSRHKSLTIFGREPRSLALMRSAFPTTEVQYSPDIVLSLRLENPPTERSGVLVCIRNDVEAKLTQSERDAISAAIHSKYTDVLYKDTVEVAIEDCTPQTFEATLEDFWNLLRTRKVVVTDRLHCMIFCAITKTPCVVLANSNHKIEGTYSAWLKDLPYIEYLAQLNTEEMLAVMDTLSDLDLNSIPDLDLSPHYAALKVSLLDAAGVAPRPDHPRGSRGFDSARSKR
ncbi:MAG: hypothetical protein JWR35_2515, partial [Marmoricola sp.]|nr:hypothetical protein [Marmoricola sp.]